ncbi:hypothetical protein ACFQY0_05505 [Haloferula chungangensis]|uniref:DUF4175 domain-containing protein n=1 Tax=Haloferula chungangensis TaxID=1048331 RepID=A0ABW2L4K3_9BACT
MASHERENYWFPAKRYGWGWGLPCSWQGWVVMIIYLAAVVALAFMFDSVENVFPFVAAVMGATTIFLWVCWKKGEPAKWRWGQSDDDSGSKQD